RGGATRQTGGRTSEQEAPPIQSEMLEGAQHPSAAGLEYLDRVTRGVVDDDLGATGTTHDFVRAKRHAGTSQSLDLCLEIRHRKLNSIPAASYLTATVGKRPLARAAFAAQQQSHAITRNRGKRG